MKFSLRSVYLLYVVVWISKLINLEKLSSLELEVWNLYYFEFEGLYKLFDLEIFYIFFKY